MSWADLITEESGTLRAQNLGAAVCADGANGLKSITAYEARARDPYELPPRELPPADPRYR